MVHINIVSAGYGAGIKKVNIHLRLYDKKKIIQQQQKIQGNQTTTGTDQGETRRVTHRNKIQGNDRLRSRTKASISLSPTIDKGGYTELGAMRSR